MNRRRRLLAARLIQVAAPACLLLAGCDPVEAPPSRPTGFKAPPLHPRRTENPDPENARWLAAWRDTRARIAPLQEQLAAAQQFHSDHQLDWFLELDPETLETDQLCQLFHFLERGYFTVERQVVMHLLERRLQRSTPLTVPAAGDRRKFKDRIVAAMQRDELRMVDLETALEFYTRPDSSDLIVPESLTEDETAELRAAVAEMLDATRAKVAEMDEAIAELKTRVFGATKEE